MKVINFHRTALPCLTARSHEQEQCLIDVLTEDNAGQYAVYRAIIDLHPDEVPEEWFLERVADRGHKLTHRKATGSFPNLPEDRYRA